MSHMDPQERVSDWTSSLLEETTSHGGVSVILVTWIFSVLTCSVGVKWLHLLWL